MESREKKQGIRLLEIVLQRLISHGVVPVDHVFDPEYQQWVMGTLLDYNEFVKHIQQFREGKADFSFNSYVIHETVTEGDKFVVRYSLIGTFADGRPFKTMVLTLFELENGRFVHSWEFYHVGETTTT